jgi:hypothetical protein
VREKVLNDAKKLLSPLDTMESLERDISVLAMDIAKLTSKIQRS